MPADKDRQACETPLDDLERMALEHYGEVSSKAHCWMNTIPNAIRFYFDAKRKAAVPELQQPSELASRLRSWALERTQFKALAADVNEGADRIEQLESELAEANESAFEYKRQWHIEQKRADDAEARSGSQRFTLDGASYFRKAIMDSVGSILSDYAAKKIIERAEEAAAKEAATGAVSAIGPTKCAACDGFGWTPGVVGEPCTTCAGTGTVRSTSGQGWIPVSDRMPTLDAWVLVHNGKWTGIGRHVADPREVFDADERWQDEHAGFIEQLGPKVTHWMPLPTVPSAIGPREG